MAAEAASMFRTSRRRPFRRSEPHGGGRLDRPLKSSLGTGDGVAANSCLAVSGVLGDAVASTIDGELFLVALPEKLSSTERAEFVS